MKVVVASDKFKGSLPAGEVCRVLGDALRRKPGFTVLECPMADGGEGTAEAIGAALGGEWVPETVRGPLPAQTVRAGFIWVERLKLAVLEMASASGLVLVPPEQRNPLLTSTEGTGELLAAAACRGARRILMGVGGSATVDGGSGAARALGWQFLDRAAHEIPPGGGGLRELRTLLPAASGVVLPSIEVLCDVDNPLVGPEGSARVYGPQKGATPEMVLELEAGLERLAKCCRDQLGIDIGTLPGGGAAGGLAAGARAFFHATLRSGIEAVMEACELKTALQDASWVVTGEGRFDAQSLRGKVVAGVARLARSLGARVAVVAGAVALPEAEWRKAGIDLVLQSAPGDVSLEVAMTRAREFLAEAGRTLASRIEDKP